MARVVDWGRPAVLAILLQVLPMPGQFAAERGEHIPRRKLSS